MYLEVSKVVGSIQLKKSVAKNGNTYLEIVKIDWKFIPTKLSMKFENLFSGDKALGSLSIEIIKTYAIDGLLIRL